MAKAPLRKAEVQQQIRNLESKLRSAQHQYQQLPKSVSRLSESQTVSDALREAEARSARIQRGLQDSFCSTKPDRKKLSLLKDYQNIVPSLHANLIEVEVNLDLSHQAYQELAKTLQGYSTIMERVFSQMTQLTESKVSKEDLKVSTNVYTQSINARSFQSKNNRAVGFYIRHKPPTTRLHGHK